MPMRWAPVPMLVAAALFGGCIEEDRTVDVQSAPPPPATESLPESPRPTGTVFVRAHWAWDGSHYVWVPARTLRRPNPQAVWVEAHWQSSPRGWYWEAGHWAGGSEPRRSPPAAAQDEPPPGPMETPPQGVPPAPTYLPPPPPVNPPPPPPASALPPQRTLLRQQPRPGDA